MAVYKRFQSFSRKIIISVLLVVINFYRWCISPFIVSRCRYYPTCSQYALEALKSHGIFKGLYLGLTRLLRCQPFSQRDYFDPVPQGSKNSANK